MNYNRQYIPNSEVDWNFIPVNGMQEYNKDYNELSNGYYSKEIQSFYNDPYQNKSVIDNCVQREPSVFLGSDKRSHIYVSSQEKNDYQELDDFSKVLYETFYGYGELEMSNGSKKDIEAYIFPYNGAFYSQDGLIVEPFFGGPFTLMDIHDDTHDIK
uniref:DUF3298 domain-containing protein n=1 Tax=Strongyloides venezuelensis TaxID=75913 RepID=A0A0K0FWT4_STRVS